MGWSVGGVSLWSKWINRNKRPVTLDLPERLTVTADAGALDRVLENLLVNAAKYSPPGSPIEVTARAIGGEAGQPKGPPSILRAARPPPRRSAST